MVTTADWSLQYQGPLGTLVSKSDSQYQRAGLGLGIKFLNISWDYIKSKIQVRRSCKTVESASLQIRISGTNQKSSLLHRHFSTFCFFFFFFAPPPTLVYQTDWSQARTSNTEQNLIQTSPNIFQGQKIEWHDYSEDSREVILLRTEVPQHWSVDLWPGQLFSKLCQNYWRALDQTDLIAHQKQLDMFPFLLQAFELSWI